MMIILSQDSHSQTPRPHVYVEREVIYTSLDNMALIGGDDKFDPQIVCLARYQNKYIPGKMSKNSRYCYFAIDGGEYRSDSWNKVQDSIYYKWENYGVGDPLPLNLIIAARNGTDIWFYCRAVHSNRNVPGKTMGEFCHIGFEGREYKYTKYQLLTKSPLAHVDFCDYVASRGMESKDCP